MADTATTPAGEESLEAKLEGMLDDREVRSAGGVS